MRFRFCFLLGAAVWLVCSFAYPTRKVAQPTLAEVGRAIFFDKGLSNPPGLACASCHDPATGYSYPNSFVNSYFGAVPGVVKGRAGARKPPSIAYAPFMAKGVPHYDQKAIAWVGGLFWDGRAKDAIEQAKFPFLDPNEMNNVWKGKPSPDMLIRKLRISPTAQIFRRRFGDDVFDQPTSKVFDLVAQAIVAFEKSPEVSPYTSKYDAYLEGRVDFTPQELMGMRFVTGTLNGRPDGLPFIKSAHCMDCHGVSDDWTKERDLWTNSCYANLGVPRNPRNPFYTNTDQKSNPAGANTAGAKYMDMGMGSYLYALYKWPPRVPFGSDPLRILGTFKAPTLRNVDKRPYPGFVKSYMHNGVLKSLKDVVHFYNTRNATTVEGEIIDFTKPNPYEGLKGKPLWPPPEYLNPTTLINPTGMAVGVGVGARSASTMGSPDLDAMQIGNLRLTEEQEEAIVAFLKTLSDGYFSRSTPSKAKFRNPKEKFSR